MIPCRESPNPDLWFTHPATAKALCQRCPVKVKCLKVAERHEANVGDRYMWGVWGGLTPADRAARRKAATA